MDSSQKRHLCLRFLQAIHGLSYLDPLRDMILIRTPPTAQFIPSLGDRTSDQGRHDNAVVPPIAPFVTQNAQDILAPAPLSTLR